MKLRIAQVAPLYESVPPKKYGGTERVVHNLTEALVSSGHEVTLFASGDSVTSARLVPIGRQSLRASGTREALAPHVLMFERVRALAKEFDIVHFHNEYMHFNFARTLGIPTVSTLHGRLDLPEYADLFGEFTELPLVAISANQRLALPKQNWVGTVHHGMCLDEFHQSRESGERYLAFLGRISPEKGVEQAIDIARRAGLPLKIAAKIEPYDLDYYQRLLPELNSPGVEFIGEIGGAAKEKFLGEAAALLFPITWPEPFGLVMIEALATGTPVIAFGEGSVPEVISHGRTGFVVDGTAAAAACVSRLSELDRDTCRKEFEDRFSIERVRRDYEAIYERVIFGSALATHQKKESAWTMTSI